MHNCLIHVSMTPQYHWFNRGTPYYWVIMEDGCNEGFGWSKTPEQAWKDALKYYRNKYEYDEES